MGQGKDALEVILREYQIQNTASNGYI